jgi:hypothetical protein
MQRLSTAKETKKLTPKGQREHDRDQARRLRHGPRFTQMVEAAKAQLAQMGKSFTKKNLLVFVCEQANRLETKVDRDATRRVSSTICWLCENVPGLITQTPVNDMFLHWDLEFDEEDLF